MSNSIYFSYDMQLVVIPLTSCVLLPGPGEQVIGCPLCSLAAAHSSIHRIIHHLELEGIHKNR